MDLIKDNLPLIEEEKKALATGGFELRPSRIRGRHSNHFATNTIGAEPVLIPDQNTRIVATMLEGVCQVGGKESN